MTRCRSQQAVFFIFSSFTSLLLGLIPIVGADVCSSHFSCLTQRSKARPLGSVTEVAIRVHHDDWILCHPSWEGIVEGRVDRRRVIHSHVREVYTSTPTENMNSLRGTVSGAHSLVHCWEAAIVFSIALRYNKRRRSGLEHLTGAQYILGARTAARL